MTDETPAIAQSYEIVSIKRSDPPPNTEGSGWYCYVITQGNNAIRGYRQGSLNAVTQAVDEIVARLNDRRQVRPGRAQQAASRAKKKAKPESA